MAYIITRSEQKTVAALLHQGYELILPDPVVVGTEVSVICEEMTSEGLVREVVYTGTIISQLSATLSQATLVSGSEEYLLTFAVQAKKIAGLMEVYSADGDSTDGGGLGEDTDPGTWEAEEGEGDPGDS